ncbi:MAG TPA: 1,4-dihydroxy-6-naphthoate synthase [Chitinophagaceae bacterium]|nr:1,4-dihydroxy-6-naphthoate synthase [Chitinophagaceae bacterium]
MILKLGFSPCPNDTFIFDALVHQRIETGGIEFEVFIEDVQTLNEWALEGKLDVTKLSFPAFFDSIDQYILLRSGAALGRGVGPILVAAREVPLSEELIQRAPVALPGRNTTAHFLFTYAFPAASNKLFMRFDTIEDFVAREPGSFGVLIHEGRFTYAQKGLQRMMDLGKFWEERAKLPVPLGGIAIKREVLPDIASRVEKLIRESVLFAKRNYPKLPDFVRLYAQEMSEEVMRQHIDLYVNDFSADVGSEGLHAVGKLHELFCSLSGQRPRGSTLLFL